MMSALSPASDRFSKLWISFVNDLLDGDLCQISLISIFWSGAIDRIAHAACPNFVHLYIPVVYKSLSIGVPYTGRFWQHDATKNNKRDSSDEQGDEKKRHQKPFGGSLVIFTLFWRIATGKVFDG